MTKCKDAGLGFRKHRGNTCTGKIGMNGLCHFHASMRAFGAAWKEIVHPDDVEWLDLLRTANDNCDRLSISRAEAMRHVGALIRAIDHENSLTERPHLPDFVDALSRARAWLTDPIGIGTKEEEDPK